MFASFWNFCNERCGTVALVGSGLCSSKFTVSRLCFECSRRAKMISSLLITPLRERKAWVAPMKLAIVSVAS